MDKDIKWHLIFNEIFFYVIVFIVFVLCFVHIDPMDQFTKHYIRKVDRYLLLNKSLLIQICKKS